MVSPVDPLSNSWQHLYERACCETDPKKLHELVGQTEEALFRRSLEIAPDGDDRGERKAMTASAEGLLRMKTDVLGWPGIGAHAHAPPQTPGSPAKPSQDGAPIHSGPRPPAQSADAPAPDRSAHPPAMPPGGSTEYPD